jgi:hypothetical protein
MEDKENTSGGVATGVEKEPLKLVKASVNVITDPQQSGLLFTGDVDKLEIPTDYHKLIKVCRFFYMHDPIAGTVLNKMVDCAITPLTNRKGECDDEEYETYNALSEMLQEFFRNVCLEYLLSGLVIPHYEWNRVKGSDLSPKLNSRRRMVVPDNIWFRDPATVTVKNSPIPNKKYFYVNVDANTISFIKSGGKLPDGSYDKETYEEMVRNYPEFVRAVKSMKGTKMQIRLEGVRPIMSKTLPEDAYPLPYMENALESLMHKRNLRRMDYAIAARVIGAIQLIKLGSDEFPCTDDGDFDHIKQQMTYRTSSGRQERVYQLFANHTLQISWVFPDTQTLLNREKYSIVEDDIIAAFGFPRTLITGETLRSNVAGGSDFAAFSPIATMETIRDRFLEWLKVMYSEIKEKNGFKHQAIPAFTPMRLYKLIDLNTIGQTLYLEGNISRKSRQELVGLDFDTEVERKAEEEKIMKEKGVPDAPQVPYSSPNIGNTPKTKKTKEQPDEQAENESGKLAVAE